MWNWIMTVLVGLAVPTLASKPPMSCDEARMKCAYRQGCGMALQNYLSGCSAVLQGPMTYCPQICQHSLIALTSTEEGKDLMQCECSDDFCENAKQRVEICRPSVTQATENDSVVSCTVAQVICQADALCSTALDYYNRYCKSMFHGKKCTRRCHNSISILRRQEKAAKLDTCRCDGNEDYDCPKIQANMARLCFHKKVPESDTDVNKVHENEVIEEGKATAAGYANVASKSLVFGLIVSIAIYAVS